MNAQSIWSTNTQYPLETLYEIDVTEREKKTKLPQGEIKQYDSRFYYM